MKYLIIGALLFSTAAQAAPMSRSGVADEAARREQLIKDLSKAPASFFNVCSRC